MMYAQVTLLESSLVVVVVLLLLPGGGDAAAAAEALDLQRLHGDVRCQGGGG